MQKLCITLMLVTCLSATCQIQENHALNIDKSIMKWKGTYTFIFSEHHGTVQFLEGNLITIDGHITGGSFVVDMTSISNEDYLLQRGPVKHLKDPDFFDVDKHPRAQLHISKVTYYEEGNQHKVEADLIIKGISQPISFYPTVDEENKQLVAKFKIDRTRWGITYNNRLKNEAISDAIEFEAILNFN